MLVALIVCFLTSLLVCLVSWLSIRREYKESSFFLLLGAIIYSSQFLYGIIAQLCHGNSQDTVLLISTYGLSVVNVILAFIIYKSKHPISYLLIFVVVLLCVISIVATIFSGLSPFTNFFIACCGCMAYFAHVLELTYKEFCVLGNIYLQAAICLMAAIAPVMVCIRKKIGASSRIKFSVSVMNFLIHGSLFVIICRHYWMPLEKAFDLCYNDLMHLASSTGFSYITVNLLIFVLLFVVDLIFNSMLYKFVKQS